MVGKKIIALIVFFNFILTFAGQGYLLALRPPHANLETSTTAKPLQIFSQNYPFEADITLKLVSSLHSDKHPYVRLYLLSFLLKVNPENEYLKNLIRTSITEVINYFNENTSDDPVYRKYIIALVSSIIPLLPNDLRKMALNSLINFLELAYQFAAKEIVKKKQPWAWESSLEDFREEVTTEIFSALFSLNEEELIVVHNLVLKLNNKYPSTLVKLLARIYPSLNAEKENNFCVGLLSELSLKKQNLEARQSALKTLKKLSKLPQKRNFGNFRELSFHSYAEEKQHIFDLHNEFYEKKYWEDITYGPLCREVVNTIDKIFPSLTDNQEKDFFFNWLVDLRKSKYRDGEVRIMANKAICKNFLYLPAPLQKSNFNLIIELTSDHDWNLRLAAYRVLANSVFNNQNVFAVFQTLNSNFFNFYEFALKSNLELVNKSLIKGHKVDLKLFLDDTLPLFLNLFLKFSDQPEKISELIEPILKEKDFLKLFRFLEVALKLKNKKGIMELRNIYISKKSLPAINLPEEAKVYYWLGRSLVIPLSYIRMQVFKYERDGDGAALEHESEMIKKFRKKLALPIITNKLKKIAGKTVLLYTTHSDYFDYADNSYRWLPYQERLNRLKVMSDKTLKDLLTLFKEGYASESLLYLFHYIERGKKGELDVYHHLGVGEVDNPRLAMKWANLSISGVRDWEHLAEISRKLILQNLLEWTTAMVYSGLLNNLEEEDISIILSGTLEKNNLNIDKSVLNDFIKRLKTDIKDPDDVFHIDRTSIIIELKRLADNIWNNSEPRKEKIHGLGLTLLILLVIAVKNDIFADKFLEMNIKPKNKSILTPFGASL